jgi:PhzF family phenazine biosynthesis protein
MPLRLFQVDAFTDRPFAGNPAAVCLLESPAAAAWMQKVAAEMNLSETAFLSPRADGWDLRWFTPAVEVPLCGHATLASAHVLFEQDVLEKGAVARFHTRSGVLEARRLDERIEIDLPAIPARACTLPEDACAALGLTASEVLAVGRTDSTDDANVLVEVAAAARVREMAPDFKSLRQEGVAGWIVTARADDGTGHDFVSRFFAPAIGIDEDPVTGAAHCSLVPYWGEKLGRREVVGFQASARGGVVWGRQTGNRVQLAGHAYTLLRGELLSSATVA